MNSNLLEISSFYCSFSTNILNLKFSTYMKLDQKIMCDFFQTLLIHVHGMQYAQNMFLFLISSATP
jgi:hypothetical protein